jgi:hypothetical protein
MRWRASARHKGKAPNEKSLWMLLKSIKIINIIVENYQSLSRQRKGDGMNGAVAFRYGQTSASVR